MKRPRFLKNTRGLKSVFKAFAAFFTPTAHTTCFFLNFIFKYVYLFDLNKKVFKFDVFHLNMTVFKFNMPFFYQCDMH